MKNEIEFDADDFRNQLLGGRSDSEIENDMIEDGEKALQEHYFIDDDNEMEDDYRNQLLGGRYDYEIDNDMIEDGEKALQDHYRFNENDIRKLARAY